MSAESSAAVAPVNKTNEEFKTMTENNMKMTSGSGAPLGANLSGIDSSDYENDEDGQYEEVNIEDYDKEEDEDIDADNDPITQSTAGRIAQLMGSQLKENV